MRKPSILILLILLISCEQSETLIKEPANFDRQCNLNPSKFSLSEGDSIQFELLQNGLEKRSIEKAPFKGCFIEFGGLAVYPNNAPGYYEPIYRSADTSISWAADYYRITKDNRTTLEAIFITESADTMNLKLSK